jgi:uncharacterized cysteine cluster protein YcgN (CxxCxxCC family)
MRRYLSKEDFEAICKRCGICCGSQDGDPCEHLKKDDEGKYFCDTYENRFGKHTTLNGTIIRCVPIENALRSNPQLRQKCAYAKLHNKPRRKEINIKGKDNGK